MVQYMLESVVKCDRRSRHQMVRFYYLFQSQSSDKLFSIDPIFFLHHTNVDRIWWLWQQANYTARAFDYSGPEFGGVNGTLNTVLQMLGLSGAADAIVGDYMETNTTRLCYKY